MRVWWWWGMTVNGREGYEWGDLPTPGRGVGMRGSVGPGPEVESPEGEPRWLPKGRAPQGGGAQGGRKGKWAPNPNAGSVGGPSRGEGLGGRAEGGLEGPVRGWRTDS